MKNFKKKSMFLFLFTATLLSCCSRQILSSSEPQNQISLENRVKDILWSGKQFKQKYEELSEEGKNCLDTEIEKTFEKLYNTASKMDFSRPDKRCTKESYQALISEMSENIKKISLEKKKDFLFDFCNAVFQTNAKNEKEIWFDAKNICIINCCHFGADKSKLASAETHEFAKKCLNTFHKLFPNEKNTYEKFTPRVPTNLEPEKRLEFAKQQLQIFDKTDPGKIFIDSMYLGAPVLGYSLKDQRRNFIYVNPTLQTEKTLSPKAKAVICHEVGHSHKSHSENRFEDEMENQCRTVQVLYELKEYDAIKIESHDFCIKASWMMNPYAQGQAKGLEKLFNDSSNDRQKINDIINDLINKCSSKNLLKKCAINTIISTFCIGIIQNKISILNLGINTLLSAGIFIGIEATKKMCVKYFVTRSKKELAKDTVKYAIKTGAVAGICYAGWRLFKHWFKK